MNRLLEIGFEAAGHWVLESDKLNFKLTSHSTRANILYAFVCDGEVKYVGKSIQMLKDRMAGYRTPHKSQSTNVNGHKRIRDLLLQGIAVQILALPDNGLLHFGQFHLNLAAGLEDDIIRNINPDWNGGRVEEDLTPAVSSLESEVDLPTPINGTFTFTLQPTYFRRGFFNVRVKDEKYLGGDGEKIELFLGDSTKPALGTIDRTANGNGTPRVMCGKELRDWFHLGTQSSEISVQVLSPTSIRLSLLNAPKSGAEHRTP